MCIYIDGSASYGTSMYITAKFKIKDVQVRIILFTNIH